MEMRSQLVGTRCGDAMTKPNANLVAMTGGEKSGKKTPAVPLAVTRSNSTKPGVTGSEHVVAGGKPPAAGNGAGSADV